METVTANGKIWQQHASMTQHYDTIYYDNVNHNSCPIYRLAHRKRWHHTWPAINPNFTMLHIFLQYYVRDSHIMTVAIAVTPAMLTKVWTKLMYHLYICRDMKEHHTEIPCFIGLCSQGKNLYNNI